MAKMLSMCAVLGISTAFAFGGLGDEPQLTTRLISGELADPMFLTHPPGDFERLFVLDRDGLIRILVDETFLAVPFLDITVLVNRGGEGGLLGLAFHPDYAVNGKFYVDYTTTVNGPLQTVVAEYRVSADPDVANPATARTVLRINQPGFNHNAGWIGFGPNDGYLYIPLGDGGSSSTAQNVTNLLGKLLRLDVNSDDFPADAERNYAIPPDNPYVGQSAADEIWGLGLRNPYRCSFDRLTGDLWMGDVGAGSREEVSFQPGDSSGGENYGWPCMEGFSCGTGGGCTCNAPDLTLPVVDYTHALGCVVTGGYVYRGCAIPDLQGTYFYADFCSNRIWSLRYDGMTVDGPFERQDELAPGDGLNINSIVAFSEDAYGELYILDLSGEIYKIEPAIPAPDSDGDGIPDSCDVQACPFDLTADGAVLADDLALLLGAWGSGGGAAADVNNDGVVDAADLALLLGGWGACP